MLRHNHRFNRATFFAMGIACLLWHSANAAVLHFDELDQTSLIGEHGDLISLSYEYTTQGITFDGGAYLLPWGASANKTGNYVSGPGTTLLFTGELPTYVSLIVGNFSEYLVELNAYGINFFQSQRTTGMMHGISVQPEDLTPYKPDQFIEFNSPTGITAIHLTGQAGYYLDDLTFTRNKTIPEPATLLLLSAGIIALILSRRRTHHDAHNLLHT